MIGHDEVGGVGSSPGTSHPAARQECTTMSTTRPTDGTAIELEDTFGAPSVSAPRTFEPGNTRECPQLFSKKWAAAPDGDR